MKHAYLTIVALMVLTGVSGAAVVSTQGWENDPYFTHQTWSFGTSLNPSMPDDQGTGNPYGDATMTLSHAQWVDGLGMVYNLAPPYSPLGERQGGWAIAGPQGGTEWFRIDIPNRPNQAMHKELWFEITFRVNSMQLAAEIANRVNLQVYADGIIDGAHKFSYFDETGGAFGIDASNRIWLRFEGKFAFDPQPGSELMLLTGTLNAGESVLLDQIDIETRCIPEPMSICLLGVGVLGMIRRKR